MSEATAKVQSMRGVHCPTTRAAHGSEAAAHIVARRAHKPVHVVRCRYCGWWHVVGVGSPLERPSKPRPTLRGRR